MADNKCGNCKWYKKSEDKLLSDDCKRSQNTNVNDSCNYFEVV